MLDLEVSPDIVMSWRLGYKINLSHDNLIKERAIICAGWKWHGDPKVHAFQWDAKQDDRALLEELIEVYNEADEVVGHNGDQFDIPWVRTRCLFHGLAPLGDPKTIDTLQWARRKFYFNSNKLDYIAQFLGLGGKLHTEYGLWKRVVMDKDPAALKEMVTYCKRDVVLLEKVYDLLAPLMKPKTHAGVAAGLDRWTCPHTGSTNVCVSKTRVTANGTRQYQMVNRDTGSYYSINESTHAAYLEAKADEKRSAK